MKKIILSITALTVLATGAFADSSLYTSYQMGASASSKDNDFVGNGGFKHSVDFGYSLDSLRTGLNLSFIPSEKEQSVGIFVEKDVLTKEKGSVYLRGILECGIQDKSSVETGGTALNGGGTTPITKHDFTSKPTFYGVGVGVGYNYHITKNVDAKIGYEFEVKDFDYKTKTESDSFNQYNHNIKLGLAYKF